MPMPPLPRPPHWASRAWAGIAIAIISLAGLTALLAPLLGEDEIVAVTMLYLLVVLLVSATWGYSAGLFSAVFADVLLNLFFVPPLHDITVQEPRNMVALVVFLAVAIVGASMLAMLRRQLAIAQDRRAELTIMLGLSRELAAASSPERALDALARSIARAVQARRCTILQLSGRDWRVVTTTGSDRELTRDDIALAQGAVDTGEVVRRVPRDPRRAAANLRIQHRDPIDTFVPFHSPTGQAGVVHITGALTAPASGDLDALLRAFADEAGVAVHRAWLAEQARNAEAVQRSDELKSALLSSVSHDLRSPLTAIKAAVGSLRSPGISWSEGDRAQLLEAIESQTDRLTGTVTGLLEMSRLEGGAIQPSLEPIQVRALLQDAEIATRSIAAGRVIRIDSSEQEWIRGDFSLLLQALINLIENAVRYSKPGGSILLRADHAGGRVSIDVTDEGPGIPSEELPHIFERFYRGGTSKRVQGTGLGLAIVRAMVELCGGTVNVESSTAGTTFRMLFQPVRPPQ